MEEKKLDFTIKNDSNTYKENPYTNRTLRTKSHIRKIKSLKDKSVEGNEALLEKGENAVYGGEKIKDSEYHRKIFEEGLVALLALEGITPIRVFFYLLLYKVPYNNEIFSVSVSELSKNLGGQERIYRDALKTLRKHNFFGKKEGTAETYFLNSDLYYYGSREAAYKQRPTEGKHTLDIIKNDRNLLQ